MSGLGDKMGSAFGDSAQGVTATEGVPLLVMSDYHDTFSGCFAMSDVFEGAKTDLNPLLVKLYILAFIKGDDRLIISGDFADPLHNFAAKLLKDIDVVLAHMSDQINSEDVVFIKRALHAQAADHRDQQFVKIFNKDDMVSIVNCIVKSPAKNVLYFDDDELFARTISMQVESNKKICGAYYLGDAELFLMNVTSSVERYEELHRLMVFPESDDLDRYGAPGIGVPP